MVVQVSGAGGGRPKPKPKSIPMGAKKPNTRTKAKAPSLGQVAKALSPGLFLGDRLVKQAKNSRDISIARTNQRRAQAAAQKKKR